MGFHRAYFTGTDARRRYERTAGSGPPKDCEDEKRCLSATTKAVDTSWPATAEGRGGHSPVRRASDRGCGRWFYQKRVLPLPRRRSDSSAGAARSSAAGPETYATAALFPCVTAPASWAPGAPARPLTQPTCGSHTTNRRTILIPCVLQYTVVRACVILPRFRRRRRTPPPEAAQPHPGRPRSLRRGERAREAPSVRDAHKHVKKGRAESERERGERYLFLRINMIGKCKPLMLSCDAQSERMSPAGLA